MVKAVDADEEHPRAADDVAEPAEGQEAEREGQHVGGDHPLDLSRRRRRAFCCRLGSATFTMVTSIRFMKLARSRMNIATQRRGSASALLVRHVELGRHRLGLDLGIAHRALELDADGTDEAGSGAGDAGRACQRRDDHGAGDGGIEVGAKAAVAHPEGEDVDDDAEPLAPQAVEDRP